MLAVDVDSSERPDIPPFGYEIDYLTFGGIYREVSLRVVPATFIENIFVRPKNVLTSAPSLDVDCFLQHLEASKDDLTLEVELLDGDRVVAKASQKVPPTGATNEPVVAHGAPREPERYPIVGLGKAEPVLDPGAFTTRDAAGG